MRRAFGLLTIAICAACSGTSAEGTNDSVGPPRGWRTFSNGGASIDVPAAWDVQRDDRSGRVDITGANDEQALVWPVFVTSRVNSGNAVSLAKALLSRAWPDGDWQGMRTWSRDNAVVLRASEEDESLTAMLGWTTTPKGTAAVLYAVSADADDFEAFAADARRAFASLKLRGEPASNAQARAPAATPGASLTWTRFDDPNERAFSLEVPQGWSAAGGLTRAGAVDVRVGVEVRSPDGAVLVRIGEPSLGTFVTGAIGFPEGSVFSPGYGQQMTVRRYVPPANFAADVASRQGSCRGFTMTGSSPRNDLTAEMNGIARQFGLAAQFDAGDVTFACAGDARGYWLAALRVVQMGGPAMWNAEYVLGYLAASGREAQAREVLTRMIGSFRLDPQWAGMQSGLTGDVSRIVTATTASIAKTVNGGFWDRTKNERARSIADSNARLGIEQVEDENGTRYDVAAGANHYWIDPQGTIAGTQTAAVPHIDFSPLTIVPPGQ